MITGHSIDAMTGLLQFADAVDSGELTINDLREVMETAIESGHDGLLIALGMATIALEDTGRCSRNHGCSR